MKKITTLQLVLCAMFAALSALLSQLSIPVGTVPINLTHISVFLAAGLLGAKFGTVSQTVFVFLGAVGLPVFSGFHGGFGVLVGPTGGFIFGYIACAFIVGLIIDRFGKSYFILAAAMVSGIIVTYALGILWFMYNTKSSFIASLSICVLPFLIGDLFKIILSAIIIKRMTPILKK